MSKKYSKSGGWTSSWFDFDNWGSNYYKPKNRAEIVKPYMSWWDHNRINRAIRDENKDYFAKLYGGKVRGIDDQNKVDAAKVLYKGLITEDLIHDIFSIYYNKSEELVFDVENDSNKVKFRILEKINNSLLKIVSNNNSIASLLYTREICNFLFEEFWNTFTEQEKKDIMKSMKDMNSESQSESSESDKGKGKGKGSKSSKDRKSGDEDEEDNSEAEDNDSEDENNVDDESQDKNNSSSNRKDGRRNNDNGSQSNKSDSKCDSQNQKGDGRSSGRNVEDKSKDVNGHNVDENLNKESLDDWKKERDKKREEKTINDKLSDKIDQIFSRKDVQDRFEAAITNADKLMNDLEKAGVRMDKADLQAMSEIINLNNIRDDIAQLAINKSAIAEAIKHILDKSINYFSKKYQIKEIDLFEADEIECIYGVEYIHPIFRSGMLDRLTTEERKPLGRIDLYVDVSGSMSSNSGIPGVSNLMFAKSIALAMLNMDMLNNLYVFDTNVRQVESTEIGILSIGCGGGTNIDCVTRHVMNKAKNNGICLTDGECSVTIYDERMFLLGTIGVYFNWFYHSDSGIQFLKNGQCINFDGKTVEKIFYKTDFDNKR